MSKPAGVVGRVMRRCMIAACCSGIAVSAVHVPPAGAQAITPSPDRQAILVTGTRIDNPVVDKLEPVAIIERSYIEERNTFNVADAINELPGVRSSITPNGSQSEFGQGVNFLNLYALGAQRTLTLVNGKRVVSSNAPTIFSQAAAGTQVDVNALPTILVERVERLAIGGAPANGSDAIAGTVNIIVKRRLTRFEARGITGVTERGDMFRWKLAAAGAGLRRRARQRDRLAQL